MRRFTILGLMWLVLGVAVAVASLRNADDYWAGGLMLTTTLLIGVATIGAVYHTGRQRAGRLGFAVFGGGYFALAFLGLSDQNLAKLPTTWLLVYAAPAGGAAADIRCHDCRAPQGTVLTSNVSPGPVPNSVTTVTTSQVTLTTNGGVRTPPPWKSLLPGAANYEAFSVIGHCLFALMAGLMGMVIAVRYHSRQQRALFTDPTASVTSVDSKALHS